MTPGERAHVEPVVRRRWRPRSAWCARSGSRRPPRPAGRRGARPAPSACPRPSRTGRCRAARPESSGPGLRGDRVPHQHERASAGVRARAPSPRRRGSVARGHRRGSSTTGDASVRGPATFERYRRSVTDRRAVMPSRGPGRSARDGARPEPADALAALRRRARAVAPDGRRDCGRRRVRRAGRASSTPGPGSASSPATTSRRTRTSASATTAASTGCASPAGAGRATCAGATRRTAGSSRALDGLRAAPRRSARPTRPSAAPSSSYQLDPGMDGRR